MLEKKRFWLQNRYYDKFNIDASEVLGGLPFNPDARILSYLENAIHVKLPNSIAKSFLGKKVAKNIKKSLNLISEIF